MHGFVEEGDQHWELTHGPGRGVPLHLVNSSLDKIYFRIQRIMFDKRLCLNVD